MTTRTKPTTEAAGTKPAKKRRARRLKASPSMPERSDDANAFIPDPGEGPARTSDDLAEALAEDFVQSATRGNEVLEDDLDQPLSEEIGGPFVLTRARDEFAEGTDESNPADAEPEALPKPVAGLVQRPRAEELDDSEDEDADENRTRDDSEEGDMDTVRAEEDLGESESEDEDADEDEEDEEEEEEMAAAALDEDGDEVSDEEEDAEELDDGTRRRTR
jgi:hypothetical protein